MSCSTLPPHLVIIALEAPIMQLEHGNKIQHLGPTQKKKRIHNKLRYIKTTIGAYTHDRTLVTFFYPYPTVV